MSAGTSGEPSREEIDRVFAAIPDRGPRFLTRDDVRAVLKAARALPEQQTIEEAISEAEAARAARPIAGTPIEEREADPSCGALSCILSGRCAMPWDCIAPEAG